MNIPAVDVKKPYSPIPGVKIAHLEATSQNNTLSIVVLGIVSMYFLDSAAVAARLSPAHQSLRSCSVYIPSSYAISSDTHAPSAAQAPLILQRGAPHPDRVRPAGAAPARAKAADAR